MGALLMQEVTWPEPSIGKIGMTPMSVQAKHQAKGKDVERAKHRGGRVEPAPKPRTTLEDRLEQGLEESFPASDPVALTQPPRSAHDARKR
jgi:hypothetical protein